jgi:YtcA family
MSGAQTVPGKRAKRSAARLGAIVLLCGLEGCGPGAPSLSLVGAYFPAWILCSLIGLAVGIIARVVLSATRLAEVVAYPLVLCIAIGAIAGILAWLAFYRG